MCTRGFNWRSRDFSICLTTLDLSVVVGVYKHAQIEKSNVNVIVVAGAGAYVCKLLATVVLFKLHQLIRVGVILASFWAL